MTDFQYTISDLVRDCEKKCDNHCTKDGKLVCECAYFGESMYVRCVMKDMRDYLKAKGKAGELF